MRTIVVILGLLVLLSGCSDDASDPINGPDAGPQPGDGQGGADPGDSPDEDSQDVFSPVYINGTLSQSIADCSDPSDMVAGGSSHDLPEGAAGRSYDVSIVTPGDIPAESICVSFGSESASTSGTIPDDAGSITVGGDFAVGTAYSIYIS